MRSVWMATMIIGAGCSCAALAATSSSSSSGGGGSAATSSASGGANCKVVHKPLGERGDGSVTSSVTAGPGGISGSTGGTHVEAGGGSVSTSSSGGPGQNVTTDSNGDCTITIFDEGK